MGRMGEQLGNWAGNFFFGAARIHRPTTIEQAQAIVARSVKVRVIGSRHSFNRIADTDADLISLENLPPTMRIDAARSTVTVGAGVKYGQLGQFLHRAGYALHNMASLPHISVAGACATATHGSGDANGNLATAVMGLEFVDATGAMQSITRESDGDALDGAAVSLGAFGVITALTLKIEPSYEVQQDVYEKLPFAVLVDNFDAIVSSAYSVSLFTDWRQPTVNQWWCKRKIESARFDAPAEMFGATRARYDRHPIDSVPADSCTTQMGVPGPWHERLPHFKMEHTPSNGEELQSEYFVPREHAVAAIQAVAALGAELAPQLMISEIRTIASDRLWMSPCSGQPGVGLHFTWKKNWPEVRKLLPKLEMALSPFDARPHWGKLFTMSPDRVRSSYRRLAEFQALVRCYDMAGKFRNAFLDSYVM